MKKGVQHYWREHKIAFKTVGKLILIINFTYLVAFVYDILPQQDVPDYNVLNKITSLLPDELNNDVITNFISLIKKLFDFIIPGS